MLKNIEKYFTAVNVQKAFEVEPRCDSWPAAVMAMKSAKIPAAVAKGGTITQNYAPPPLRPLVA